MSVAGKRTVLKQQYQRFLEAWANEKRYQQYILEEQGKLPEGVYPLGRKPTFGMWMNAIRNKKITPTSHEPGPSQAAQEEKSVQVQESSWEDEPGGT